MMSIDDLIYGPIEEPKTFHDLCEEARQRTEDQFKHLRGKLAVRQLGDRTVIIHKDLATQALRVLKRRRMKSK